MNSYFYFYVPLLSLRRISLPKIALAMTVFVAASLLIATTDANTYVRRVGLSCTANDEVRMSEAVDRAIEATKRRHPADYDNQRSNDGNTVGGKKYGPKGRPTKQSQPRMHTLDVERLNRLIKAIDVTWMMPRRTARKEPIGSNFQFKKTCASIYKARPNACQQLGFGVMCFNFCYEQGEVISLKCEDLSDAYFCKSNANFAELLAKYRKDAYRAKSYIHQMMSRCYATSICDEDAMLNATQSIASVVDVDNDNDISVSSKNRRPNNSTDAVVRPATIMPDRWRKRGSATNIRRQPLKVTQKINELNAPSTSIKCSANANDISDNDDQTEEENWDFVTPKYVPFWQRLLVHKKTWTTTKPLLSRKTSSPKRGRQPEHSSIEHSNEATTKKTSVVNDRVISLNNGAESNNHDDINSETPPRTAAEAIRRRQRQLKRLRLDSKIFVEPSVEQPDLTSYDKANTMDEVVRYSKHGNKKWESNDIWRKNSRSRSIVSREEHKIEEKRVEPDAQPRQFHGHGFGPINSLSASSEVHVWTRALESEENAKESNDFAKLDKSLAAQKIRSNEADNLSAKIGTTDNVDSNPRSQKRYSDNTIVRFLNQFHPRKWFRSIHYFTNTG